ncbi:MAG: nitroreductase family protein [Aerococcus sp.]|nr:nitroreductase family protein [Aerococcus sp.]
MLETPSFTDIFKNRHSIRHFDPNVLIDQAEVMAIIEDATNTPSAFNLQPWRIVAVNTPEARAKVKPSVLPANYSQFDSAPVTLFVLGDPKAHNVFRDMLKARLDAGDIAQVEYEELLKAPFLPLYDNAAPEFLTQTAITGASMLAMSLLLNIRAHGYEDIGWYGFDMETIVDNLDEDSDRYIPVLAISLGKPDETLADEEHDDSARYHFDQISKFL